MANLFAITAPGLEAIAAAELEQLGLAGQVTTGGVEFAGEPRDVYRANLHLRTASRVLLRVGEFYAAAFSELRKKAARLPWDTWLQPGQPVAIKATAHKSRLYHSDAIAERVAGAIGDRLGQPAALATPPAADDASHDEAPEPQPAQLVLVRLVRDLCTVSVDTSGALLHQRGYRLATAKAPLRETLAAGMLLASGWDRASPLLDPFCGAGTIVIEAALLAAGVPPGRQRRFAFMDWPGFDRALWDELLAQAGGAPAAEPRPVLLGTDRDAGAVEAARANAERAGAGGWVRFDRRALSALEAPPVPGWVVSNPPYGLRVKGGSDLRNLYTRLGQVLRTRCPGWHVALLGADRRLARSTGLPFDEGRSLPLVNGGVRVTLEQARVPAKGK